MQGVYSTVQIEPRKYVRDHADYYSSHQNRPHPGNVFEIMQTTRLSPNKSNPGHMYEIMPANTALTKHTEPRKSVRDHADKYGSHQTYRTQEMCSRSCTQRGSHRTDRTQGICTRPCRLLRLSPKHTESRKCVRDHADRYGSHPPGTLANHPTHTHTCSG